MNEYADFQSCYTIEVLQPNGCGWEVIFSFSDREEAINYFRATLAELTKPVRLTTPTNG